MTNAQMLDHFAGKATYYFWADGRIKTPYALLNIDIDNHKIGTLEAVQAFARDLRDNFFSNLYFENSTGGKGIHGYVIIDKRGFGDERLHGLAKMLDRVLKAIHRQLPRQMLIRFDGFKRTTVLDSKQISQLYLKYKDEPVASVKPEAKPSKAKGSLTGCVVKQANLDLWDSYLNVASTMVVQPLKTKGREVATAVDMAILLLILEACTNNMNDDGSMPTARIRENWDILFSNGDVERPWQPRRFTSLRDQLSSLGHIEWEDRRYVPAALSPTKTGQAAKWRLTEALMDQLAQEKLEPGTAVVVAEEEVKADEALVEVPVLQEREGEEDLYYDKNFFIDADDPSLDWLIDFSPPRFIRPVLEVGVARFRMAA